MEFLQEVSAELLWVLYLKSYLPAILFCPYIYILLLMCINTGTVETDASEVVIVVTALCGAV